MASDVVLRSGFRSYDRTELTGAIREMVRQAGGWPPGAVPGARVLLKVNMLSAKLPERAITTHPSVVAAVATLLLEKGCVVTVGDSPGGAVKGIPRYWEICGYQAVARELGIELVNFESSGSVAFRFNKREIRIARPVVDADVRINLCKFKTHAYCRLTNAVKNVFGVVPGFGKAILHSYALRPADLSEYIVEVYRLADFHMTIMDAILAMDGKGPSTDGDPRMDGILGVAVNGPELDMVMTRLAGLDPMELDTSRIALRRGLCGPPEAISVEGLESCRLEGFRVPGVSFFSRLPPFLGTLVRLLFKRPPVTTEACTACRICVEGCPVGAVSIRNGRAVMNGRKCILCLCCHEICPERAVKVRIPFTRT